VASRIMMTKIKRLFGDEYKEENFALTGEVCVRAD
jgi:hypothetical protein